PAEPASARKPEARLRRGIADGPRGRPPRRGYGKCNPRPCGLGQVQAVLALVLRSRRWQALAAPSRADDKIADIRSQGDEARLEKPLFGLVACAILYALPIPIGTAAAQAITVGATSSTSDAPIYIADKKGYFRDEGLDVKVVNFRSAADMVAPLGAGQIEAGAGSASAGLYNAVARGIKIKIVADKASSPPGYGGTKILVRKDH